MKKKLCCLVILFLFISMCAYDANGADIDGGPINSADTILGVIDNNADSDSFTFDGIAGQSVVIGMSQESGNLYPKVELFSPNGSKENETEFVYGRSCRLEHILKNTGQYTIVAMDAGATNSGNYSLSLQIIPGDTQSNKDADGGLIDSRSIINGRINSNADLDAYVFNGIAGQSVVIGMSQESGNLYPKVELFSPNGSKENETEFVYGRSCRLEHILKNTGQYTIVAMDAGATNSGNYSLSLSIFGSGSSEQPSEPTPDDVDGDGISNTNDNDDDNDGFTDFIEGIMGTNPLDSNSKPIDSENDGIPDSIDDDDDNDGYTDVQETSLGTNPNDEKSYPTNIEKQDSDADGSSDNVDDDDDNDGYTDLQELYLGTNPLDATSFPVNIAKYDSDGDGIVDSEDTDDDNDGMTDIWELFYGLNNLIDDAQVDVDKDQYANVQEFGAGTNPRDKTDYPGKGPSPVEPFIQILSVLSAILSIGVFIYAYINKTKWSFKRGIKKSDTLEKLKIFKDNKIQPAIDSKKLKPTQVENIMNYYKEKKTKLGKK
jgi:hypothetical protein